MRSRPGYLDDMRVLRSLEALARRPWFFDALLGGICLAVVVCAFLMTATTTQASLFGWDVPVLCTLRRLTGWSCPGCGMTRSFVLLAHGQLADAFRTNVLGPPMFLVVAAQVPWSAWRIVRRARRAAAAA